MLWKKVKNIYNLSRKLKRILKCKVSEKSVFFKSSNPSLRTQKTYFWLLLLLAGEKRQLEIPLCPQAIAPLNLTFKVC